MSILSQDQESNNSIISIKQNFIVSRTSTHDALLNYSTKDIIEEMYYSVHIGGSVLTRENTKKHQVNIEKSSCAMCLII